MGIGQSSHGEGGADPQDSPGLTARVERCFGALPDIRSIVWPKVDVGDVVCDMPEVHDAVDRRNSKRSTPDESAVQKELEAIFEEAEKEALSTNDFFLLVPGDLPADSEFTFSRDNNPPWEQSGQSNSAQPQYWDQFDTTNVAYSVQNDRHFRPVGILQPRPRLDFDRVVHSGPVSTGNLFIPIHDLEESSVSPLDLRNTPELRRRDELPHFRLKPRMEASNRTEIPDTR